MTTARSSVFLAPTTFTLGLDNALGQALSQVVGAIMLVFLVLAVAFVIAAYAEAASHRIRPKVLMTKERHPRAELPPVVLPIALLGLTAALAMLMGVEF